MPSLRRSFSSPSVRSSPYPSSLSAASTSAARARAAPVHPRRSSGSATSERRVLADIEWWRVYDGQCDTDLQDQPRDDPQALDTDVPPSGTVTLSPGAASLHLPEHFGFPSHSIQQSPFPDPFAALSIAPYSPTGSNRSRDLSVESTPELPPASLESVQFSLASPVSFSLGDHITFSLPLTRPGGRHVHPLFGTRSVSAPALSHQETLEPNFADMGGDFFSLDQNLFQ